MFYILTDYGRIIMENYIDLIKEFHRQKNDLICFNSFSNDVRLFRNHIIKTFNSPGRLERCIVGLQIMSNTDIKVPTIQFICTESNTIVESYIEGISLNEYTMHLTRNVLHDIGKLMGNFHNTNVSSEDGEESWILNVLSDMKQIRIKLAPYEEDFLASIIFVETECKTIFKDLHFTYVHGDFKPSNIILNTIDNEYYLIDFENFMVGDPTLDIYKMLSILKANSNYGYEDVIAFLNGYASIKSLPQNLDKKWIFYDVYYSLRSVRRAINDNNFRKNDDQYIINADQSAQMKNPRTLVMTNWLEQYVNSLN